MLDESRQPVRGTRRVRARSVQLRKQAFVLRPGEHRSTDVVDRDNVLNLHYGIPHKDGTKDDIQFLGMINYITPNFYESTNDIRRRRTT